MIESKQIIIKATKELKEGIANRCWDTVLNSLEMIKVDDFNWRDVPSEMKDDWDDMQDDAMEILEGGY